MLCISLSEIANVISIVTPVVLLFWFIYTQKQSFNIEFLGIYAGYMDSKPGKNDKERIEGGMIMNIRDIESSGYFRGEFDYRENFASDWLKPNSFVTDSMGTFYGYISYRVFRIKKRNPLRQEENRIYQGKLYIVDRLDIQFGQQKIEEFLHCTYNVTYFREYRAMKFELESQNKEYVLPYPTSFFLYKTLDLQFEQYKNVKETVFRGMTRVDKKG